MRDRWDGKLAQLDLSGSQRTALLRGGRECSRGNVRFLRTGHRGKPGWTDGGCSGSDTRETVEKMWAATL